MKRLLASRAVRRALIAALVLGCALIAYTLRPPCEGGVCPSAEALRDYRPPQASMVLDRDGKLLARLAPEQRIVVSLDAIPEILRNAFLAVEDRRFYEHHGIDWRRTAGALLRDVRTLSLREGSSTLTMQLARNLFPRQLGTQRTLRRKLWEAILARKIENTFNKQQIFELYLNQIYLGNGLYGVEAAAQGYFGRPARALDPAQAALLAALPKAPSSYDPRRFPEAARKRRDLVLRLMRTASVISAAELKQNLREPVRLAPLEEEGGAPWFVGEVRRELHDRFGPEADRMGLRVHTGLDLRLQRIAERELVRQIKGAETRRGTAKCAADPAECLQGLFVALDPGTGEVTALVGGRDYRVSEFDRATLARRQAGSAFKPIVWAAALSSGVPISTLLAPANGGGYLPADRGVRTNGPLNLREALRVSSNRAAVALGERVGMGRILELSRQLGLTTPIGDYPSTVLGAASVEPLELTAAFAPFFNGGLHVAPHFALRVESAQGETLWEPPLAREPVLSPGVAFLMTSLLSDVVDRGTGMAARAQVPADIPVAGKTGTTNDAQDVWFVGATPELVASVWLGYDRPRPLGKAASGAKLAAPVFSRVLGDYYRGHGPLDWWPRPPDVEEHDVDVATGGLAVSGCPSDHVSRELFLQGTAPGDCAEHHGGVAGFFERAGRWLSP
jgi:penicillin-binding protein 1A